MIKIRLAEVEECEKIQLVFNESKNSEFLGGFSMIDPLRSKAEAGSMVCAFDYDTGLILGASEISTEYNHRMKMSLVAVDPEHKQNRIATAMYTFWSIKAALSGRYLRTDQIIGDNPVMPNLLPTLGFRKEVSHRSKVRRHHSLDFWVHSLLEDDPHFDRVPSNFEFQVEFTEKDEKNFMEVQNLLHAQGRKEDVDKLFELRAWVVEEFVRVP